MDTFILKIDNAPDIHFQGTLIGQADSSPRDTTGETFSPRLGRWTELYLYRTAKDHYICHSIGRTHHIGENDRYTGAVCNSIAEVKDFFGHRWLAKQLYDDAGIVDVMMVD